MKRYLVKCVCIPTLDIINNYYKTNVYYFGRRGECIAIDSGVSSNNISRRISQTGKWRIREDGYKRKCDARKCWVFNEYNAYWRYEAEIICFDV